MEKIQTKIDAQAKYCKEQVEKGRNPKWLEHGFTPKNGICFACHNQIYEKITLERASTQLITGCPYCCRSYCD